MDRFISSMIAGGKLIVCYLIAAVFQFTYMLWPNFGGDPHILFSAFPWSLIWSPFIPIDTVLEILTLGADPTHIKAILVFGAAFIASFAALFWMPQFLRKNA
jgi:hypothetical protein